MPGIITLAVVSATTQSLAINLTEARESGRLKRIRATPLPTWAFVAGRVGNALVTSLMMVVLVTAIGTLLFDVEVPTSTLVGLLATLLVGAFAFSCLGFALTAAIPTQEAASPITNVALFPLYFLSGVFIPDTELPEGVLRFADLFPIRHFFAAGIELGNLAIVGAWGIAGLLVALRWFRWAPRG